MSRRLKYETKGGYFDEKATLEDIAEFITLAAEACYAVGHHRKENGDMLNGQGFLAIGQLMEMTKININDLAMGKLIGRFQ